ncbi:putative neutral sphingomyelinase isoform X3 [Periplaneta americana]|uniref:putative neutral sphingomyelinase isoform X3 n=1 Tax=Periplaneta americana TaxID=6978 RepID=UPI0037E7A645
MSVETDINVFTLNCWGIPGISKDRQARMNAIAEELALGKYDIVCLQEVWSENDYLNIKKKTSQSLPFSHYFYSGVFGSGVCIFSKYVIEDTFFHQWPVNGYIHKLHHGDWFGGKGIGLCKVKCKDITINIYSAHVSPDCKGTNESIRNSYTDKKLGLDKPDGKRIDYILYKARPGLMVNCLKYQFPLPDKVPEETFSFSDHEAVQVTLRATMSEVIGDTGLDKHEYVEALNESRAICNAALAKLNQDKRSYWIYSAALFLTLLCTIGSDAPYGWFKAINIIRIIVTILLCFTVFMASIWNRTEVNAILTGKLGIGVVHAQLTNSNLNEKINNS